MMVEPRSAVVNQVNMCRCGHDYTAHPPIMTVTIGGTATTGQSDTITINGVVITFNQTTGNTVQQTAQGLVNAINANPLINKAVFATNPSVGGVFTIQGINGQQFTYTSSSTGGNTVSPSSGTPTLTCFICSGVCKMMSDNQYIASSGVGQGPALGAGDIAGMPLRTEVRGPEGNLTGDGSAGGRPPLVYHN